MQDEGTVGVEAMQALRTWVRSDLGNIGLNANNGTVVTRRPRVLRWCSRYAATFLLSHGHGALGFAWIQRLRCMEQGTARTETLYLILHRRISIAKFADTIILFFCAVTRVEPWILRRSSIAHNTTSTVQPFISLAMLNLQVQDTVIPLICHPRSRCTRSERAK